MFRSSFKIGGGLAGLLRGDKEQTVYAVNNISFTLRRGESLGSGRRVRLWQVDDGQAAGESC